MSTVYFLLCHHYGEELTPELQAFFSPCVHRREDDCSFGYMSFNMYWKGKELIRESPLEHTNLLIIRVYPRIESDIPHLFKNRNCSY